MTTLVDANSGEVILPDLMVAQTFWTRFRGLQCRESLPEWSGLWLSPCSSLHTCFMRFSIDIFMLDRNGRVLGKRAQVPPWRFVLCVTGTYSVLETSAGSVDLDLSASVRIEN